MRGGDKVQSFLTSALDAASLSAALPSRKVSPVGKESRSGRCGEEKNFCRTGNQTGPIAIPTELSRFLATTCPVKWNDPFIYIYDRLCGLVVKSSWLQISALPEKKKVVGLERGPLSLVSTTEELLDRKVAAPV
jgi:hypothetical protein